MLTSRLLRIMVPYEFSWVDTIFDLLSMEYPRSVWIDAHFVFSVYIRRPHTKTPKFTRRTIKLIQRAISFFVGGHQILLINANCVVVRISHFICKFKISRLLISKINEKKVVQLLCGNLTLFVLIFQNNPFFNFYNYIFLIFEVD